MGFTAAGIASYAGAAAAVVGTAVSIQAQSRARSAAKRQAGEQEKIKQEQRAANAAKAAEERRAQIREERVRRARVLQSAENTGVADSSGEQGAIGSLSTNLSVNIGSNAAALARGDRISQYAQNAADFGLDIQQAQGDMANGSRLAGYGGQIFSASGGFGNIFKSPTGTDNSIFGTAGSGSRGMGS